MPIRLGSDISREIASVSRSVFTTVGRIVIPADPDLAELQTQLLIDPKGRTRLREHLQRIIGQYDFVLLDCPPDMGVLTQSALVAAHEAVIPVDVGFFSVAGLARIVSIIDDIRNTYNPELKIAGVLATKYDPRTTHSRKLP